MTWIDDAAAEIDNLYGTSPMPQNDVAAIIDRNYARHLADISIVPVDLARLLDEAQAEQRRLEGELAVCRDRIRDLERELCYKIGRDK